MAPLAALAVVAIVVARGGGSEADAPLDNVTLTPAAKAASRGNPACWYGPLNYERCCLPEPLDFCFDHYFTPERCCSRANWEALGPLAALRDELFFGVDPYGILDHQWFPRQKIYPDSHLTTELVTLVIRHTGAPSLWLEIGSFVGNSAITTADVVKEAGLATGIICMDPFTGDQSAWATRKPFKEAVAGAERENMLMMDQFGHSRIFETFLANVRDAGHEDIVMPLRLSSISGMRLLARLRETGRVSELPQVIYLDSAHEEGETLLEIREAWRLLPTGGLLFGDDWSWDGVRADAIAFAREQLARLRDEEVRGFDTAKARAEQPVPGLILVNEYDGTWIMLKKE